MGFSFGSLVFLKTLINKEDKIKEVYLSTPYYIVNGNALKALFKVFIAMKFYLVTKKIKFVEKFLDELFTDRDEFAIKYLSKVFLNFNMDFIPVPLISKAEAKEIKTPITLIVAKEDIMFPDEKMLIIASKILSSVKKAVLLEHSKHAQYKVDNIKIKELIMKK